MHTLCVKICKKRLLMGTLIITVFTVLRYAHCYCKKYITRESHTSFLYQNSVRSNFKSLHTNVSYYENSHFKIEVLYAFFLF